MEEDMDYSKAENIVIDKLKELKINIEKEGYSGFKYNDVSINLGTVGYSWRPRYNKVNIRLKYQGSGNGEGLRNFDVVKGNYQKLTNKLMECDERAKRNIIARNKMEKAEEDKFDMLMKELKEINPKKDSYSDNIEVSSGFLSMTVDNKKEDKFSLTMYLPSRTNYTMSLDKIKKVIVLWDAFEKEITAP